MTKWTLNTGCPLIEHLLKTGLLYIHHKNDMLYHQTFLHVLQAIADFDITCSYKGH